MKKTALLVGMHFRPPAKHLLEALSTGVELLLDPEPDNPYDSEAIRVSVRTNWIALEKLKEEDLLGCGQTTESLAGEERWHLGYLAREGNRDLEKKSQALDLRLAPAGEVLQMIQGLSTWTAKLLWGPNGEALVRVESLEEGES